VPRILLFSEKLAKEISMEDEDWENIDKSTGESTDENFLVSELIVNKFVDWWSKEKIIKLLSDDEVVDQIFLENLQLNIESGMDHLELAKILFDQIGEKFFFSKVDTKENTYRKKFKIISEILIALVEEQPSLENEINKLITKHFDIQRSDIPKYIQDEDEFGWTPLEEFLYKLPRFNNKTKFIEELVEICGLPDACSQKEKKETIDRKSEIIDPIGIMNTLYDFQYDVGYQLTQMLKDVNDEEYKTRAIIALPTGAGKTRLVVETIIDWINNGKIGQPEKKFILWIVDKDELCQQAYDAFKTVFIAKGERDTSLNLQIFWGKKSKNITDALHESMSEAQGSITSVIIASQGSLHSIYKSTDYQLKEEFITQIYSNHVFPEEKNSRRKEIDSLWKEIVKASKTKHDKSPELDWEGTSIRKLGKTCAITIIDEAHHAIADSYTEVLRGLGFEFAKTQTHPQNCRLLGLTATPFRREKEITGKKSWKCKDCDLKFTYESEKKYHKENNQNHEIITSTSQTESERLRNRFGKNFLWPSLEAHFKDEENHPHPIIELQQTATLGRPVRISGDRSYDQDGKIKEYYWQITIRREIKDYTKDPWKYDTGRAFGENNSPEENFENWANKDKSKQWHSTNEKGIIDAENEIFDQIGTYHVSLWVKDDEGLVSPQPDIRVIKISEPPPPSGLDDPKTLKEIYEKLIEREVLSRPTRWELKHDSQAYLDSKGIQVTYKQSFGKTDYTNLSHETLQAIATDPRLNEKILAAIKKLVEEEEKESILLFGLTIDHAKLLSGLIKLKSKSWVKPLKSEVITYKTHTDERCKFIKDFRAKKIQVLCNDSILTTGFDAPKIDAIVNAKYTNSLVLYNQMIGRGLRGPRNGGTKYCTVVDLNPNITKAIGQLSEEERIEAWQFLEELWDKETSRVLTNKDLGLRDDEEIEREIEKKKLREKEIAEEEYKEEQRIAEKKYQEEQEKERKEIARRKQIELRKEKVSYCKNWIQNLIKMKWKKLGMLRWDEWRNAFLQFSNFPELQEDESLKDFFNLVKENELKREERENEKFEIESKEILPQKESLSFHELMLFIANEMKLIDNYQPVMIKYLLSSDEYSAKRYEISKKFKSTNPMNSTIDFTNLSVYQDLINHNIVKFRTSPSSRVDEFYSHNKNDDVFTLKTKPLQDNQMKIILRELDYQIALYAKRQGGVFIHTCPKCKIVTVKYHKPPKQHEREEMDEKFGFRGERIQSYCRGCRS